MHPRIAELLTYIDEQRVVLRAAIDNVPADRRSKSPGEDRWSVDEVVEHLATIEPKITSLFRARVSEARTNGLATETATSPILPELNVGQIVDRGHRLKGPNSMRPTSKLDSDAAWAQLEISRRDLRDAVADADGLALGTITHPHLAFGPFTMYKWIAFIGAHEARHADQIREIGASLAQGPA